MLKNKNLAFTLIEMMIVFAIIGIMSVFYIVNTRPRAGELLKMDTTRLAADIRYVRSMATTRATHNGSFPGGYGIIFKNGNGTTKKSEYSLYAGLSYNTANHIKTVALSNIAFRMIDPNSILVGTNAINDPTERYFTFKSENDILASGFGVSADGDYQIEIYYDKGGDPVYYDKAKINIGRKTEDNFVWSNLAITFETKGIVCGNGIVEAGESCERFDDEGNLLNANCFPVNFLIGGVNVGCKFNNCGDGVVAGTEQCERNTSATIGAVPDYLNLCEFVSHYDWCYLCAQMLAGGYGCRNMKGEAIGCCQVNTGHCTDCHWDTYSCPIDIQPDRFGNILCPDIVDPLT
jgi:prepilin-type N-terminal cleavage/methylation domain-containing protein